ncbi:MAG: glycine C-acetyltransferase [bacterium]
MNQGFQDFMRDELEKLKKSGLYNTIRTLESAQGSWVEIEGKELLNFSSNNYLGLANHPETVKAAQKALDKYGIGPGAVRTIAGTMTLHEELEKKLAEFKKVEAVLSFQSGFNANLAAIPAIVSKGDTIFSDALNHASIIDGCRLSGARVKVFEHGNMEALEQLLKEHEEGRGLIATDGVFSMDGDIANLPEIVKLAEKYNVMTMVDDAHGEGVLGSNGRGIVDHFDLHERVDIEIGTFSKALGTVGGCVAGSKVLVEYLKQKARPFLFSSAVTPPDIAATIKSIEILQKDDSLVKKLWSNGDYFKKKMKAVGFDVGNSQTPITPVMIGEAKTAAKMSKRLFAEGVFAQSIGYPTVPKGEERIRVMISAVHEREDIDFALNVLKKVAKELDLL